MKINTGGSSVTVNGVTHIARQVTIVDGKVYVDGVESDNALQGPITVTVNGNAESVEVAHGSVTATGNIGYAKTMSGNVRCSDITGNAKTMSGDIICQTIGGSASTMSGDIINR